MEESGDWTKVGTDDGFMGYVPAKKLKDKETKKLAKKNAGEYMKQMENTYSSKYVIRQTHLEEKLEK